MGRWEAETLTRSGPGLVLHFDPMHFFPLLEKMFSHSAWLLLADLTVQLPVGACTLNTGKIAAFKNKIVVQAGVFQVCFGDSPSFLL